LKLNGLHGVISQKMILFKTTAVKTSNPTPWVLPEKTEESHKISSDNSSFPAGT
jgi:hypothetical protein